MRSTWLSIGLVTLQPPRIGCRLTATVLDTGVLALIWDVDSVDLTIFDPCQTVVDIKFGAANGDQERGIPLSDRVLVRKSILSEPLWLSRTRSSLPSGTKHEE